MREVALLVFDGQLIESLREYWASEVVELAPVDGEHHGYDSYRDISYAPAGQPERCVGTSRS